jgi:hypothetical protein
MPPKRQVKCVTVEVNLQAQPSLHAISEKVDTLISGFRRDVDEICTLLGYYMTLCGTCLLTFATIYQPHLQGQADQEEKKVGFPFFLDF